VLIKEASHASYAIQRSVTPYYDIYIYIYAVWLATNGQARSTDSMHSFNHVIRHSSDACVCNEFRRVQSLFYVGDSSEHV